MKFLLCALNAKYIHANPAVRSLSAYAGDIPGCRVIVREFTINQLTEDILAGISEEKPDAVGFSCYIWNIETVKKLVSALPRVLPETKIYLGGPEVSFHSEEILREMPEVTAIMTGEGEEVFRDLLISLAAGELSPSNHMETPCFPHMETPRFPHMETPRFPHMETPRTTNMETPRQGCLHAGHILPMDSVPFCYDPEISENRIIYYESSRGCPFRCSYCLSSIDKTLRLRSIARVTEHLDRFLTDRVPQVKFIDRTFNANHEHAHAIWQYLSEHDNGVTNFHFEIAADLLTEDEILLLNRLRPGLVQLEIGVQTVNDRTLGEICRPADTEKIRRAALRLRAPGNIHIHLDLIAGLPCEDYDSFVHSFNEVYSMQPHELQLGFLKVLKGTRMEEKAGDYGLQYLPYPPYEVLSTRWITYEELRKLKAVEEMLEIHYNSRQFTQTIPLLETRFAAPFSLYEALAAWYKEHDYFLIVPGRARRYEILLEFAESLGGEAFREKVRETLTLDYYLREDPKKRPAFVHSLPDSSRIDTGHRDPVTGNFILRSR